MREVHHVALLVGYGAAAINPYLALETVEDLVHRHARRHWRGEGGPQLHQGQGQGIAKVMSKMGVSTVASYRGAQIFEAIGLSQELVDNYFTGTVTKLGGVGLDVIAEEVARRHATAYPPSGISPAHRVLTDGGEYQWRRDGEPHLFDPETVFRLQHATRAKRFDIFREYTQGVNEQAERLMTLRGLFAFRDGARESVSLDEVESIESIASRFSTGAMSYGSISAEAHETLAIAMNRLGGKSNTGKAGKTRSVSYRWTMATPAFRHQAGCIKRFGVTSEYLVNSDDIQSRWRKASRVKAGSCPDTRSIRDCQRHSTPASG